MAKWNGLEEKRWERSNLEIIVAVPWRKNDDERWMEKDYKERSC